MQKKTEFVLNRENIDALSSMMPTLHSLSQGLEGVVNERIMKELNKLSETLQKVMEPIWKEDDKVEQNRYDYYSKTQQDNKFSTYWSADDVEDFAKPCDKSIKTLSYYSQKLEVPSNASWLELWEVANNLIKLSGDQHHVFIERFIEQENGHYTLSTGS